MPFSEEDKVLIKHYYVDKGYGAKKILKAFPNKKWNLNSVRHLLQKIKATGDTARRKGSGRPRSARTEENGVAVLSRVISDPHNPHGHLTPRQISNEIGISESSVRRIVKEDLQLKAFKRIHGQKLVNTDKEKRVKRSRKMLRRLTVEKLKRTFFTDEKVFTVDPPLKMTGFTAVRTLLSRISAKIVCFLREAIINAVLWCH